jgi:HK97 family phage major capsid protein
MKKSDELKKVVDELKAKADQLQAAEQYDEAFAVANELKDAIRDYKTAKAIEEAEATNFIKEAAPATNKKQVSDAVMRNRIFNKQVFGKTLNEEEMAFLNIAGTPGQVEATPAKGGYLVPEEQISQLMEFRRAYTQLKNYCSVRTANSNSGKFPTIGAETGTLTNFDELNSLNKRDINFGQLTYTIDSYGDIIPVSRELLQDADINLMDVIGQRFARMAVNTENAQIVTQLGTLTATSVSTYKNLMKALNVDLDPAFYANAKIFTNQDGFQWMSELEDGQHRPLLVPDVAAPDSYRFRGKEVVVLSNNTLETDTTNSTIPFYIGSMADYIAFFQRKGVEVAVSDEAGFTQNATLVRAIERFGVTAVDSAAMKAYTVSTAP